MTARQAGMLLSHQAALVAMLRLPQNKFLAEFLVDAMLDEVFLNELFADDSDEYRAGFVAMYERLKQSLAKEE